MLYLFCTEEAHLPGRSSQIENMTRPFPPAPPACLRGWILFWREILLAYETLRWGNHKWCARLGQEDMKNRLWSVCGLQGDVSLLPQ